MTRVSCLRLRMTVAVVSALIGNGKAPLIAADSPVTVERSASWKLGSNTTDALAFVSEEPLLAVGRNNGTVGWWSTKGKNVNFAWPKGKGPVTALAIAANGKWVAAAWGKEDVQLLRRDTQEIVATVTPDSSVTKLAFAGDGSRLAIAEQGRCQIVELPTGKLLHTVTLKQPALALGFIRQDQALCIADDALTVNIFEFKTATEKRWDFHLKGSGSPQPIYTLLNFSTSTDQRAVLASFPRGLLVSTADPQYGALGGSTPLGGWTDFELAASADGRFAICVARAPVKQGDRGLVRDLVENRTVAFLRGIPATVQGIAFEPRQKLLAVTDSKGELGLWDLKTILNSPTPPTHLLKGRVALSNTIDPDAPLSESHWRIERHSVPNPPPYFQNNVWRLTPTWERAQLSNVKVLQDGTFFHVLPRPTTREEFAAYALARDYLYHRGGWLELGECPWKPNSTLFCRTQSAGKSSGIFVQTEPTPGSEVLFMTGYAHYRPEHSRTFSFTGQADMLAGDVHWMLMNDRFQGIENLSTEARRTQSMFGWGRSTLSVIDRGLEWTRADDYEVYLAKLKAYQEAFPNSPTPKLKLVNDLINRGWAARGGDIAVNLNEEQVDQFQKFLADAVQLLEPLAESLSSDPAYEQALIRASPRGAMSADSISNLVLQGLKKNPQSASILHTAADFLLPRWTGSFSATSELAERIRQEVPGDNGRALAAIVALNVFAREPERWIDAFGFDPDEFQEDWKAFQRLGGVEDFYETQACQLMAMYGDRQRARKDWVKLGIRRSAAAAGSVQALLEWSDRLEEAPQPALRWHYLGRGAGNLGIAPDGNHLLALSNAGQMKFFRTADGELIGQDIATFLTAVDVALPKAEAAVIAMEVGILRYDNADGVDSMRYPRPLSMRAAKLSSDGSRLVMVTSVGEIVILNADTGAELANIPSSGPVDRYDFSSVAISPDRKLAAVSVTGKAVQLIELEKGLVIDALDAPPNNRVSSLCFHSQPNRLVATGQTRTWEWDLKSKGMIWEGPRAAIMTHELAVSPDGRYVALLQGVQFGRPTGQVVILDRRDPNPQWHEVPEIRTFSKLRWHPDKPLLATYSISGIVRWWDVKQLLAP